MRSTLYLTILLAGVTLVFGCGSDKKPLTDSLEAGAPGGGQASGGSEEEEKASETSGVGNTSSTDINLNDIFVNSFFNQIKQTTTKKLNLINHESVTASDSTHHYYNFSHEIVNEYSNYNNLMTVRQPVILTLKITVSEKGALVDQNAIDHSKASVLHVVDQNTDELIATYVIAAVKTNPGSVKIHGWTAGETFENVVLRVEDGNFYLPSTNLFDADPYSGLPGEVSSLLQLLNPKVAASGGFANIRMMENSEEPFIQDAFSTTEFAGNFSAASSASYDNVSRNEYAMVHLKDI